MVTPKLNESQNPISVILVRTHSKTPIKCTKKHPYTRVIPLTDPHPNDQHMIHTQIEALFDTLIKVSLVR